MTETSFKKDRASLFTCSLEEFDPYLKGLEQQLEQARSQTKLDWESELQTEIKFCKILKMKRKYLESYETVKNAGFAAKMLEPNLRSEALELKGVGVDADNLVKVFEETGEIL